VFKSSDAGETFTDVSGDLPDTPANWSVVHNGHLVVGTDIGVFESCDNTGGTYSQLGTGLPAVPISTLRLKPGDPDLLVAATYGRGVYTYRFADDNGRCPAKPGAPGTGTGNSGATACAAKAGFKTAAVRPRRHGLRFAVKRKVKRTYSAALYRQATLRRTKHVHRVRSFGSRRGSFNWRGSKKLGPGYFFAKVRVRSSAKTVDERRFPLVLKHGRFHRVHQYYGRATCKLLRLVRLSGPAFGGGGRSPLKVRFATLRSGRATITVRRAGRLVKRFKVSWKGRRNVLRKLPARGHRRGLYKVTVRAGNGQTVTLYSRRI